MRLVGIFFALGISLVMTKVAVAGNGPGGVGTTNGASALRLWLRADRDVSESAGEVGKWGDFSGYENHALLATLGDPPTIANSIGFNNQKAIAFPLAGAAFSSPDAASLDLTSGLSSFCAVQWTASGNNGIFSRQAFCPGTTNYSYYIGAGGTPTLEYTNGSVHTYPSSATIGTSSTILGVEFNQSTFQIDHSINGASAGSATGSTGILADSTPLFIGAYGCSGFFPGEMAEIILYGSDVNVAEAALVQNYLSSKYDIDLNATGGAVDLYDGDSPANGNYDFDVRGIAQISATQNTNAAGSGLNISNAGFLQDNFDSIVYGHSGIAVTDTTSDLPTTTTGRWTRDWYLDVRDASSNGGNVTLQFDFAEAGRSGVPSGFYRLLYRAGTSGSFSDVTGATPAGGNIVGTTVSFTVSSSNLPTGYYTLGTNGGTLPVTASICLIE